MELICSLGLVRGRDPHPTADCSYIYMCMAASAVRRQHSEQDVWARVCLPLWRSLRGETWLPAFADLIGVKPLST